MILSAKNLATGYLLKNKQELIHKDLELLLPEGKLVGLIGPNGSGKSTLLKTIAGLQRALEGSVSIGGKDLASCSSQEKSTLLSLVLTDKVANGFLSVEQLISFGRYPHTGWGGKLSESDWQKVDEAIELCHLQELRNKSCDRLSDGERQRVMIARAIAQDTPIIILDEPTAHLDLSYRVEILMLLKQLSRKTNKSIVVATHELELAIGLADQLWLMPAKGSFHAGLPEELVLSGAIANSFNSELVRFQEESGNFKINRNPSHIVSLKGNGMRKIWTERALNREEIGIALSAETEVEVGETAWQINGGQELTSLAGLISELHRYFSKH